MNSHRIIRPRLIPTEKSLVEYVRTLERPPLLTPRVRTGMSGRYRVMVLDGATKRVVSQRPWAKNLILDQGLNNYCDTTLGRQLTTYAVVGTGTTPTFRDSGAVTVTVASGVATASGAYFEAGDVGRLLKLDSGEEYYIDAFTSTTEVDVTGADAGASLACIWYVNQTGLVSESKRTNTYLTGAGNCGSSLASNVLTYLRTYDFSVEGSNQNYTELGWANTVSAGSNLNIRTLISGGSVTVLTGQQLRVIHELDITITPATATGGATTITGWPVAPATDQNGSMIVGNLQHGVSFNNQISGLSTDGAASSPSSIGLQTMEPSYLSGSASASGQLGDSSAALPAFNNTPTMGTTGSTSSVTLASYTPGSFTRSKNFIFGLSNGNGTAWRKFSAGNNNGCPVVLWDQAQTKVNTHVLTITQPYSVQRLLTNP